jgi:hypothetical protein
MAVFVCGRAFVMPLLVRSTIRRGGLLVGRFAQTA